MAGEISECPTAACKRDLPLASGATAGSGERKEQGTNLPQQS